MNTITLNSVSLNRVSPNVVQLNSTGGARKKEKIDYIKFADPEVERICLTNFDANGDGKIQLTEASAVTTFGTAFSANQVIETFDEGKYFKVSGSMQRAFQRCNKLRSVALAGSPANLNDTFSNCAQLTDIDLSRLDTSKCTEFSGIFGYCSALRSVNVSNFDTSNATGMSGLFIGCSSLTSVDLSSFVTSKAINISNLFYSCSNIERIDLSNFDFNSITTIQNSFCNCTKLTTLDLSGCKMLKVNGTANVFERCSALANLILDDAVLPNANLSFKDCTLLTLESVEGIINALPDSTTYPTLTLHVDAIDRYEEVYGIESVEDACIEKGWMLAESGTRNH